MKSLPATLLFCVLHTFAQGQPNVWPVPYQRYESRPPTNPYCQAMYPFCPTGRLANTLSVDDDDVIKIYAMKAPVFEFRFGDLLGKKNIMHDAIGIESMKMKKNFTMEWYELFEVFNCTFPHVRKNETFTWCNQGASCFNDGIDAKHWTQNGTLVQVGNMSGLQFSNFLEWVSWDNNTGIFYETWKVHDQPGGKLWFESHDCATWVILAFQKMADLGAHFDDSIQLKYTAIHLYSDAPEYLGTDESIFGPGGNQTQAKQLNEFYKSFQPTKNIFKLIIELIEDYEKIHVKKEFYLYYNYQYWFLKMKKPYMKMDYTVVPLPKTTWVP